MILLFLKNISITAQHTVISSSIILHALKATNELLQTERRRSVISISRKLIATRSNGTKCSIEAGPSPATNCMHRFTAFHNKYTVQPARRCFYQKLPKPNEMNGLEPSGLAQRFYTCHRSRVNCLIVRRRAPVWERLHSLFFPPLNLFTFFPLICYPS